MSRHFAALEKVDPDTLRTQREPVPAANPQACPSAYRQLVQRLFDTAGVISIVGFSSRQVSDVSRGVAVAASASSKRVVVVPINRLGYLDDSGDAESTPLSAESKVWVWPRAATDADFFTMRICPVPRTWLSTLRAEFDYVVLACCMDEGEQPIADTAALADACIIVVEAGMTRKSRIENAMEALQTSGASVVGSVLIKRS